MRKRKSAVEAVRILGAFGIVYFHCFARPGHEIAYSGLIVFIMLSACFAAQRPAEHGTISQTTRRYLVPWAMWFAIYGALNRYHQLPITAGGISGILAGSSLHLWFLPWACLCVALTRVIRRRVSVQACGWIATTIALGIVGTVPIWRPVSMQIGAPWAQYIHATAPFCWGVIMAQPSGRLRTLQTVCVGISLIYLPFIGQAEVSLAYLVGAFVCLAAVTTGGETWTHWALIEWLASAMYGVYLCHLLVISLLAHCMATDTPVGALLCFAAAVACTLLFQKGRRQVLQA